jgi:transposase
MCQAFFEPTQRGKMLADNFDLESLYLGGNPIIRPFMQRMRLRKLFEEALGSPDRRFKLNPVDSCLLLVRNFVLSRHPLYAVPDWVKRYDPAQLEISKELVAFINDDRLGRALDKLFEADLRTLMTEITVHMVKEYDIDLERFHNDSTSITFSGVYKEKPLRKDGRRRLKVVHGHNKDHRPDLKQLVWSLTVSEDGAVPVHYNVYDGNVTDDRTHIETWQVLRKIVGSSDFIYAADSKLCTRENMEHIDKAGGLFITVLPRTRKEDARFKQYLLYNKVDWQLIWERPPLRRKHDPPERFEAIPAPEPSSEGYRVVWYRSSEKWKRDERTRDNMIQFARQEIHRLRERVGKRKLKTREQVQQAAEKIIYDTETNCWIKLQIVPRTSYDHRQVGPGRPGDNTRYARETTTVYEPFAVLDEDSIRASAAADGVFPLVTNIDTDTMSALDLLQIYKYQSFIEKRHEQLKTAADAVPVNYKNPERIEAFLFLYFVAVTIHALIERQVRIAMKGRKIRSIPLYPEQRACRAPTADKILELFESMRRHRLFDRERQLKTFWDPLSDVQRMVLDLLEVPVSEYSR